MPQVTRRFTVPGVATGKRDYDQEVLNGSVKAGISLRHNEQLVIFAYVASAVPSIFPFVQPPMAPGVPVQIINTATGLPTPYTVPAGYNFSVLSSRTSFDQVILGAFYVDGWLYQSQYNPQFVTFYEQNIIGFEMAYLDPGFLLPHTISVTGTNMGLVPMQGSQMVTGILTRMRTEPFPTTKTVRCKHCEATKTVEMDAAEAVCDKCGEKTLYFASVPGGLKHPRRR